VTEALHIERLGFDMVTLHRDALHGTDPTFELWTLLSWVAASTRTIQVAPVVLALPHRYPAVLAKMAETLSRLCNGRLVPRAWWRGTDERASHESLWPPKPLAWRKKVGSHGRGLSIYCVALWRTSGFSSEGRHFRTQGAVIEPKPEHPIPVWLGVFGGSDARSGWAQS